jgi:DNA anti-recombination protein RmuC
LHKRAEEAQARLREEGARAVDDAKRAAAEERSAMERRHESATTAAKESHHRECAKLKGEISALQGQMAKLQEEFTDLKAVNAQTMVLLLLFSSSP